MARRKITAEARQPGTARSPDGVYVAQQQHVAFPACKTHARAARHCDNPARMGAQNSMEAASENGSCIGGRCSKVGRVVTLRVTRFTRRDKSTTEGPGSGKRNRGGFYFPARQLPAGRFVVSGELIDDGIAGNQIHQWIHGAGI